MAATVHAGALRSRRGARALAPSRTEGRHAPREIERLKSEYRLALVRDGYALVDCELAIFKPKCERAEQIEPRNIAGLPSSLATPKGGRSGPELIPEQPL